MMRLYSALQSTLQSCGGGGGLSSTTTSVQHPLGWLAMIDKGQWWEFGQDTVVTPLFFTRSVMGFVMTTESQDLGLTSHPKDGFMLLIPCYNKDVHQSWTFMRAWDKNFNKFKIWVQKCTCMSIVFYIYDLNQCHTSKSSVFPFREQVNTDIAALLSVFAQFYQNK